MKKKAQPIEVDDIIIPLRKVNEESKEELLFLLDELKRLNIRSISDLENIIAHL